MTSPPQPPSPPRLTPPPQPNLHPLPPSYLPLLLSSDSTVYPSPLTLRTLTTWFVTAPSFSLYYTPASPESQQQPQPPPVAVALILPILSPYWEQLISGVLKEWDIVPSMLLPEGPVPTYKADENVGVGLHIWHIERFPGWDNGAWGPLWHRVGRDLDELLRSKGIISGGERGRGKANVTLRGFSGLAVTDSGRAVFEDGLGWKEAPEYEGQWVVMDHGKGGTRIVEKRDWGPLEDQEGGTSGLSILGNCRMLVKFSDAQHGVDVRSLGKRTL